jgi:hypothetical protein
VLFFSNSSVTIVSLSRIYLGAAPETQQKVPAMISRAHRPANLDPTAASVAHAAVLDFSTHRAASSVGNSWRSINASTTRRRRRWAKVVRSES